MGEQQAKKKPTCFVIMPISDAVGYDVNHFGRVYEHLLKPAIVAAGYEPIRADDTVKTDYIVIGIIRKIVESEMVVCDISSRNPNVMYELGIRHAFNKPVVLVKDKATEKMFDIQGLRYTEYDQMLRVDTVAKDIEKIADSVAETMSTPEKDTNSIVHLAGIKAADVPPVQNITSDTQLVLAAISDLERRFDALQRNSDEQKPPASKVLVGKWTPTASRISGESWRLPKSDYNVGDQVFVDGRLVGTVHSFHDDGRYMIVDAGGGARYLYNLSSDSLKSIEVTSSP